MDLLSAVKGWEELKFNFHLNVPEYLVYHLGLTEEMTELVSELMGEDLPNAVGELGDIFVYAYKMARAFGVTPEEWVSVVQYIESQPHTPFPVDFEAVVRTIYKPNYSLSWSIGHMASNLKRKVRDDKQIDSIMRAHSDTIVRHLCQLSLSLNYAPSAVIQKVTNKLNDRAARGKLQGEGSER
jgi:hypothetical protein